MLPAIPMRHPVESATINYGIAHVKRSGLIFPDLFSLPRLATSIDHYCHDSLFHAGKDQKVLKNNRRNYVLNVWSREWNVPEKLSI
jgi:hypothetical protein